MTPMPKHALSDLFIYNLTEDDTKMMAQYVTWIPGLLHSTRPVEIVAECTQKASVGIPELYTYKIYHMYPVKCAKLQLLMARLEFFPVRMEIKR